MVLFDENGRIQKYETVDDIIEHFCNVRFQYYVAMKKHCLEVFSQEIQMLSNKIRFLQEVMDDKLVIYRRDYDEIVAEMTSKGYNKKNDSFDYLLNMNIRSFTKQKLAELQKELDKKTSESKKLKATSEKKLWLRDLKRFEDEYIKWDRKN